MVSLKIKFTHVSTLDALVKWRPKPNERPFMGRLRRRLSALSTKDWLNVLTQQRSGGPIEGDGEWTICGEMPGDFRRVLREKRSARRARFRRSFMHTQTIRGNFRGLARYRQLQNAQTIAIWASLFVCLFKIKMQLFRSSASF